MSLSRKLLNKFRRYCVKILGLEHFVHTVLADTEKRLLFPDSIYSKLLDRILLAESIIHWRLLGMPMRSENINLELAATHKDSVEIKDLISEAYEDSTAKFNGDIITRFFGESQNGIFLLPPGRVPGDFRPIADGIRYIMDPNDLLYDENRSIDNVINSDLLVYLQSLEYNSVECIWISDYLFQVAPVKALFTLKTSLSKLIKGGRISGRWFDRLLADPRLISLFSADYFGLSIFKDVRVNFKNGIFELFNSN